MINTKNHPKPVPHLSDSLICPSLLMCTCEEPAGWKFSQDPDALCQQSDSREEAGLYSSRLYTQPEPANTGSQERTTCSIQTPPCLPHLSHCFCFLTQDGYGSEKASSNEILLVGNGPQYFFCFAGPPLCLPPSRGK